MGVETYVIAPGRVAPARAGALLTAAAEARWGGLLRVAAEGERGWTVSEANAEDWVLFAVWRRTQRTLITKSPGTSFFQWVHEVTIDDFALALGARLRCDSERTTRPPRKLPRTYGERAAARGWGPLPPGLAAKLPTAWLPYV